MNAKSAAADLAAAFSVVALFAYSSMFNAPYAVPKVAVLVIGAVAITVAACMGSWVGIGRLAPAGVVLLVTLGVSLMFANDPWVGLFGRYNSYSLGMAGLGLALIFYLASCGGGSWGLDLIAVSGAILGLHAFAQWCGFDAKLSSQITGNRSIGTMGSPVDMGIVLAAILPVSASRSNVYAVAVALGILGTGSRGAIISAVLGVLAWRYRCES